VVAQAVVTLETSRQLSEAGLSPLQVADLQSVRPPKQVIVGRVDNQGRAGAGFAVGIVLYLALTFAGSAIATTVAMEKSTRISEVLLAVLRPSQVLVGTVVAVGAVTLVQLLVLAAPLAVAVQVTDNIGLPPVAAGDIALAVAWFVLGFMLYAFLFAAAASSSTRSPRSARRSCRSR
jgi:ABC-2 type transport system permease protein